MRRKEHPKILLSASAEIESPVSRPRCSMIWLVGRTFANRFVHRFGTGLVTWATPAVVLVTGTGSIWVLTTASSP